MVYGMYVLDIEKVKANAKKHTSNGKRARDKLRILERDEFKCVFCGSDKNLTIDHVNNHGEGINTHNLMNSYMLNECQTLCRTCHITKNCVLGSTKKSKSRYEIMRGD